MEKIPAALALIWIFNTLFFLYQAEKDGKPYSFAVFASTLITALGAVIGFLIAIIVK